MRLLTDFGMDSFDPFILILSGQSDMRRTLEFAVMEPFKDLLWRIYEPDFLDFFLKDEDPVPLGPLTILKKRTEAEDRVEELWPRPLSSLRWSDLNLKTSLNLRCNQRSYENFGSFLAN